MFCENIFFFNQLWKKIPEKYINKVSGIKKIGKKQIYFYKKVFMQIELFLCHKNMKGKRKSIVNICYT